MGVHTRNPSAQEAGMRRSYARGQPKPHRETLNHTGRPYHKSKAKQKSLARELQCCAVYGPPACAANVGFDRYGAQ